MLDFGDLRDRDACYRCGEAPCTCPAPALDTFKDLPELETLEGGQTALAVSGEQRAMPGLGKVDA